MVPLQHKLFQLELILLDHAEELVLIEVSNPVEVFFLAQIQLETHAVEVLLHSDELPERLSVRNEAHDVADTTSFAVLAGSH